jgi:hypothetical protein
MKQKWLERYESMEREIEKCRADSGDERDTIISIECCFNIALKYWSEIQMGIEAVQFDSSLAEIDYYKTVKPLFRSQIEYYNLLYQAELLRPGVQAEIKEFWLKEQQRLDRFVQSNRAFYDYYKSGARHLDEAYFLSLTYKDSQGYPIYHDDLIAMILALERYMIFVGDKINPNL